MPIESILERYGIVLHRDENGKQSVIELPIQFEQQGEGEELVRMIIHYLCCYLICYILY